ncbi:hypothetical protein C0995_011968 [Termitomyces sp. Mi166|nr:hypothetical protein C0995_011968 [Termitomyces sp. Mi166\
MLTSVLPTQSPTLSDTKLATKPGPIIGSAVGGVVFLASIAIMVILIMRRQHHRQVPGAQILTVNPLLQNPHIIELATQNDRPSAKRPVLDTVQSGSHNQPVSPGPSSGVESAIQHQMELMSQHIVERIMISIEAQLQNVHSPPDYTSQASE